MKVSSLLADKRLDVVSLAPGASLESAAKVMNYHGVGAVMIQDVVGNLVGIFTERDLVQALASIGPSVLHLSIGDFMTREVQTCRSIDDLSTVRALMKTYAIRHVPVVDQGRLVGMVSVRDLLASQLKEQDQEVSLYLTLSRARQGGVGYYS